MASGCFRYVRLAMACAAAAWLPGCAVDDVGLVRVHSWRSAGGVVVRLESWGLHLLTRSSDAGLTLGRSDRTYFFPAGAPVAAEGTMDLAAAFDASSLTEDAPPERARLSGQPDPVGLSNRDAGVGLRFNHFQIGVWAGIQHRAMLMIPVDFEGVVVLESLSDRPAASRLYVQETPVMKEATP